jgi:hypothetical protein
MKILPIAVVIAILLGALALAQNGVVVTKSGVKYEGEITERGDLVIVRDSRNIQTTIKREDIESITYRESVEQSIRDRLEKLGATDVPGRIALAREAFNVRQYTLARDVLESALEIEPRNEDVLQLLDLVSSQMRMEEGRQDNGTRSPGAAATVQRPAHHQTLLSADDINVIRQKELRRGDTQVRINIPAPVKRRFAEVQNIPWSEFNAMSVVDQALMILDKGDDESRREVRITSDPASLAEFRRSVHPLILNGCASSGCHGGMNAGGLVLISPATSEAATYTNFYILSQYAQSVGAGDGGPFGGGARRMIQRGSGARSILAEFGLPANLSEADHPKVPGYNGIFRNRDDSRYENVVRWMNESLVPTDPNYGIKYTIPRGTKPSEPSTAPAN